MFRSSQYLFQICRANNLRHFVCAAKSKGIGVQVIPKSPTFLPVRSLIVYENNPQGTIHPLEEVDYLAPESYERGFTLFREECKRFIGEAKNHLANDPKIFQHGDTEKIFVFKDEECLKPWRVSYDKKTNDGNSECSLIVNNQGKGVFSGAIDTCIPKDGKVKYTGYCGIKSKKLRKSFYRQAHYDWTQFTEFEIRFRGDGRTYALLLGMGNYYDVVWLENYAYYLFTHGGPYWQTVRIPFSKFFLTNKGKIAEKQRAFERWRVDSIGVVAAQVPGPFKLEIDYIGVHCNMAQTEKFAYEMYKIPEYFVSHC